MARASKQPPSTPSTVTQPEEILVGEIDAHNPTRRIPRLVAQQSSYQGPIPPPELFKQYGQVVADAPERILKQFELDAQHFREISKTALQGEIDHNQRGQWMAFALVVIGTGTAAWLAYTGLNLLAYAIIGVLLVAVLVNFLRPNKDSGKVIAVGERSKKITKK